MTSAPASATGAQDFNFTRNATGLVREVSMWDALIMNTLGMNVAVGSVFLLLQACYGTWRLAALSFFTLPSALVGGVLAVFASSRVISLGSLVGLLTVLGIAARNGILLISHYQHLEKYERETFGLRLVLRGSRDRLSPILMTTLATGLALVPLVVLGDIPGHEIEHPMAVVILGGLVTSTVLNLFLMPALYLAFGHSRRRDELGVEDDGEVAAVGAGSLEAV